jgi:hypothetical protein
MSLKGLRHHLVSRRRLLAAAAAVTATAAFAQEAERRVRVAFEAGKPARSYMDRISDFEAVSYVIALQKGQTLHVVLATNNASNCFDIHAPGAPKPIYVGADSGNDHKLVVQAPGEYMVRVFLLRLAARDGQSADYTLDLAVSG